jgi:hypothetical protein
MTDDGDPVPLPLVPDLSSLCLSLLWGALLLTDAEVAMAIALVPLNPSQN